MDQPVCVGRTIGGFVMWGGLGKLNKLVKSRGGGIGRAEGPIRFRRRVG